MNLSKFDLSSKSALITGAAGLLGYEHAYALLECNARVILTDINEKKLLETHTNLRKKFNSSKILSFHLDVTSLDSLLNLRKKLRKENIEINILINNAAIDPKVREGNDVELTRLENFPLEQWNKELSVGLTGPFLCSKVFGSEMALSNKGGVIINIASDLSVIAPDQRLYRKKDIQENLQPVKPATYSVIKSGLIGLTKYLATYWNNKNIRCNALSPGGVYQNQNDEFHQKIKELIPLHRMANKEEYRSSIQFLCSDASSYMNGHNLIIDGGRTII